jgi:hypothetical protein
MFKARLLEIVCRLESGAGKSAEDYDQYVKARDKLAKKCRKSSTSVYGLIYSKATDKEILDHEKRITEIANLRDNANKLAAKLEGDTKWINYRR